MFFTEIEKHSAWLVLKAGDSQAVSNVIWACTKLEIYLPKLFDEIELRHHWLVKEGNFRHLATTAWSCAKWGVLSPKLFGEIERQSARLVEKNGTAKDACLMTLAFAILGIPFPMIFAEIKDCAARDAVAALCYAFAVLDLAKEYENRFRKLWLIALGGDTQTPFDEDAATQLAQAYAFATTASGLKMKMSPVYIFCRRASCTESKSQRNISCLLKEVGFRHEVEVSPFRRGCSFGPSSTGMLAIDLACRETKVAILEVDGPHHFLKELKSGRALNVENGIITKAKRRFLERLGWKVVNIRYFDWYDKDRREVQALLRRKLHEASLTG
jgi:hypothetical protein